MNARAGYSILEVLIAFAIMSMTLAVLLPGQTQLLGRAGSAAERALAHDLALSRIETIAFLGFGPATDTFDGWRVEQAVSAVDGQRQVTVSVFATGGQQLAQVTRRLAVRDAE